MKLTPLAERVRTLVVAAGLAVVASLGSTQAYAADAKAKVDPAADAPVIIATAKIACDPSGAKLVGPTDVTKADGTKVKGNIYEVGCKVGPGFIAVVASPTDISQTFTCAAAFEAHKKNPQGVNCTLPENAQPYKWLAAVIQPYVPGCDAANARLIGSSKTEPLIDRYEVGCTGKAGGILDYPQLGTTSQPAFKSCLVMEGASACQFTTKEQLSAQMAPLGAKGDPKCQVNNVRFVGVSKENDSTFYEFGCANQPGFMVQTKMDNTFVKAIPCAQAAGLGGGCTFTDMAAAAGGQKGYYTDTLKKAGISCTVSDFNVLGTQESSKRDYVEFKCPEQKWGLIGFVPQQGSSAGVRVTDCFLDQVGHKGCSFVTTDQLKAQLDVLIKAAEPAKACDVADVRYIGESTGVANGVIAELACKNKRGYIVVVSGDRTKLAEQATPCRIAKAHNDEQQCQIAGNGTYNE
ncbi:hypothetical protein [Asticcacaulis solisilvae]|uniref:hypothetical protein n=1 Tax=Asticcacaulis solisilvae TaxID=1217274 RepID=UPI003FD8BC12